MGVTSIAKWDGMLGGGKREMCTESVWEGGGVWPGSMHRRMWNVGEPGRTGGWYVGGGPSWPPGNHPLELMTAFGLRLQGSCLNFCFLGI